MFSRWPVRLAVLAGCAGVEQAAKKAGVAVKVPFSPGRMDARRRGSRQRRSRRGAGTPRGYAVAPRAPSHAQRTTGSAGSARDQGHPGLALLPPGTRTPGGSALDSIPSGAEARAVTSAGREDGVAKFGAWAPVYVHLELLGEVGESAELFIEAPDADEIGTSLSIPLNLAGISPGTKFTAAERGA